MVNTVVLFALIGVTIAMSPHSGCRQLVVKVTGPNLEDGASCRTVCRNTNRREIDPMRVDKLEKNIPQPLSMSQ